MILHFQREQIVCMVATGFLNKKAVLHYDVCKKLADGKTQEQIAEELNIEPRTVRQIKSHKCTECK